MTVTVAQAATAYAVGGAAIAAWLDIRRPHPPGIRRAFAHTAAALAALAALPYAVAAVTGGSMSSVRVLAVFLLIILPAFVYAFFAGFRLLRTLAFLRVR